MINITKSKVFNMESAIRGMRNPKDSWHLSDSRVKFTPVKINGTDDATGKAVTGTIYTEQFELGKNDLELGKKLCNGGDVHRKFLRQIFVSVDVEAPLYWWKEYDTYKVATVANSTSTMHKIQSYPIDLERVSHDHLSTESLDILEKFLDYIEGLRQKYNETKDKAVWYEMIQLLPSSWNQKRTLSFNYETLVSIYKWRHNHKLEEWRTFCKWIETLPYAKELIVDTAMYELSIANAASNWFKYQEAILSEAQKYTEESSENIEPENITPDADTSATIVVNVNGSDKEEPIDEKLCDEISNTDPDNKDVVE